MRIAPRIISIFLPLFIVPMVFITFVATTSSREAITSTATRLLQFKAEQLLRFASSENQLLKSNGLADSPQFVTAAKQSVADYAVSLAGGPSELIAAFDAKAGLQFSTGKIELSPDEKSRLLDLIGTNVTGWREIPLGGAPRVAVIGRFEPFGWTLLVTDTRDTFFRVIDRITTESVLISLVALTAVILLVVVFSRLLTTPLKEVASAMRNVVQTGDLSGRVGVLYADEVGDLATGFNSMTGALENAYGEIKNYALQAAIAQRRESKIRNVFQKYVPNQVIEQFFVSPDSMLVGQDRALAVLFSDIRGFTTMSEQMTSRDIVESLNQYFGRMVDAVMRNNGLVDKYIGDAIMAFFGAPADDEQSCYHSVLSALDMQDELEQFNAWQTAHGRAPIHTGIGINYGMVTIGNIGSQQKMDYTVVGDMVNVASRLEGLTRYYDEPLLISESVHRRVGARVPCRVIDRVQVKGRTRGFAIYSAKRALSDAEAEAWKLHERGIQYYYNRDFAEAMHYFEGVHRLLPEDPVAPIFLQRCRTYIENPPPESWTGVVAYSEK